MAIRLVISITAADGKGSELAQAFAARCAQVVQEPGCQQFEIFQSAVNTDKLVLLELWADQAALDVHSETNKTRTPLPRQLFAGSSEREDYIYERTR